MTDSSGELSPQSHPHTEKTLSKKVSGALPPVPLGALPWDEEKVTFSRDKGKLLTALQRENVSLRTQLKELNRKLDDVITEIQARRAAKPRRTPKNTVHEELRIAQHKLELAEKEHLRLQARFSRLSDSDYQLTLADTVAEQGRTAKSLEQKLAQKQVFQSKREKTLGTVLETGETPEMSKSIELALIELNVLKVKTRALEKSEQQTATAFEKLSNREAELAETVRKLQEEVGDTAEEDGDSELLQRLEASKREDENLEKMWKYELSKLKGKSKQLSNELQDARQQEAALKQQVQDKAAQAAQSTEEIRRLSSLAFNSKAADNRSRSTPRLEKSKVQAFVTEAKVEAP